MNQHIRRTKSTCWDSLQIVHLLINQISYLQHKSSNRYYLVDLPLKYFVNSVDKVVSHFNSNFEVNLATLSKEMTKNKEALTVLPKFCLKPKIFSLSSLYTAIERQMQKWKNSQYHIFKMSHLQPSTALKNYSLGSLWTQALKPAYALLGLPHLLV